MKPKLIIFDMDGTLIDSEIVAKKAFCIAGQEFKVGVNEDNFIEFVGLSSKSVKEKLLDMCNDEEMVNTFLYAKDLILKRIVQEEGLTVKTGIVELLSYLKEKKYIMAVATSSNKSEAENRLKLTGLLEYFDIVVGGDGVENGKPAPDIYLKVAKEANVDVSECVVFEDSLQGATAAINAKMTTIVIPDMIKPTDYIKDNTYAILNSAEEAIQLID